MYFETDTPDGNFYRQSKPNFLYKILNSLTWAYMANLSIQNEEVRVV